MLFPSTVAGSLPKPSWLAEPNKLWPQWRLQGEELAAAKLDATLLAVKWQEDAGIDIVCDGEMNRLCAQSRDGNPRGPLQSDGAGRAR